MCICVCVCLRLSKKQKQKQNPSSLNRFAQRAKTIKNTAMINQKRSVEELEAIVKKLSSQLKRLQQYIAVLEGELEKANVGVVVV
jgi:uncharacterized FlaG/YvyC family protein